jgi:hypothetical protein
MVRSHHWGKELGESREHAIIMTLGDRSVDRRRLQERTTRGQRDHSARAVELTDGAEHGTIVLLATLGPFVVFEPITDIA